MSDPLADLKIGDLKTHLTNAGINFTKKDKKGELLAKWGKNPKFLEYLSTQEWYTEALEDKPTGAEPQETVDDSANQPADTLGPTEDKQFSTNPEWESTDKQKKGKGKNKKQNNDNGTIVEPKTPIENESSSSKKQKKKKAGKGQANGAADPDEEESNKIDPISVLAPIDANDEDNEQQDQKEPQETGETPEAATAQATPVVHKQEILLEADEPKPQQESQLASVSQEHHQDEMQSTQDVQEASLIDVTEPPENHNDAPAVTVPHTTETIIPTSAASNTPTQETVAPVDELFAEFMVANNLAPLSPTAAAAAREEEIAWNDVFQNGEEPSNADPPPAYSQPSEPADLSDSATAVNNTADMPEIPGEQEQETTINEQTQHTSDEMELAGKPTAKETEATAEAPMVTATASPILRSLDEKAAITPNAVEDPQMESSITNLAPLSLTEPIPRSTAASPAPPPLPAKDLKGPPSQAETEYPDVSTPVPPGPSAPKRALPPTPSPTRPQSPPVKAKGKGKSKVPDLKVQLPETKAAIQTLLPDSPAVNGNGMSTPKKDTPVNGHRLQSPTSPTGRKIGRSPSATYTAPASTTTPTKPAPKFVGATPPSLPALPSPEEAKASLKSAQEKRKRKSLAQQLRDSTLTPPLQSSSQPEPETESRVEQEYVAPPLIPATPTVVPATPITPHNRTSTSTSGPSYFNKPLNPIGEAEEEKFHSPPDALVPASPARSETALTAIGSDYQPVQEVHNMVEAMRSMLGEFGVAFDSLGGKTAAMSNMAPRMEVQYHINRLARKIAEQDERQMRDIEELKGLLNDVVQDQIIGHLRRKIEDLVDDLIDSDVDKLVKAELDRYMPESLVQTVQQQNQQLESVRINLHNAEARRSNAGLRAERDLNTRLTPLLTSSGKVSAHFPKNMEALFGSKDSTVLALLKDYKQQSTGTREKDMNRMLNYFGVHYQLVGGALLHSARLD